MQVLLTALSAASARFVNHVPERRKSCRANNDVSGKNLIIRYSVWMPARAVK